MSTFAALRQRLPAAFTLLIIVALSAAALLAGRSWLAAHDAAIHLEATLKAQEQVLAEANRRQRERDASLAAALAQINAAKRRVNTPAQAAAEIPNALPPLPQPIEIHLPPPESSAPHDEPAPPAVLTVPQPDLKPIYDYLQDCRACQISLAATRENMADEQAKLAAVTTERDAAIQASRGGSFWTRLKRNAKWFALGAAAAASIAAAH